MASSIVHHAARRVPRAASSYRQTMFYPSVAFKPRRRARPVVYQDRPSPVNNQIRGARKSRRPARAKGEPTARVSLRPPPLLRRQPERNARDSGPRSARRLPAASGTDPGYRTGPRRGSSALLRGRRLRAGVRASRLRRPSPTTMTSSSGPDLAPREFKSRCERSIRENSISLSLSLSIHPAIHLFIVSLSSCSRRCEATERVPVTSWGNEQCRHRGNGLSFIKRCR